MQSNNVTRHKRFLCDKRRTVGGRKIRLDLFHGERENRDGSRVVRACRGFFRKISARDKKFFIRRPAWLIRRIRTRRGRILAGDLRGSFLIVENGGKRLCRRRAREPGCPGCFPLENCCLLHTCAY